MTLRDEGTQGSELPALPYVARPRLWTWRLTPEIAIFLFIGIFVLGTGPKGPGFYGVLGVLAVLAIGLPVWLLSRTLSVSADGVRYRPFLFVSRYAPYSSVRGVEVEQRITNTRAGRQVEYLLHVSDTSGRRITIGMDAYRAADVRFVARVIVAHAPKARLNNLSKHLIKGDYAFTRQLLPAK